MKKRLLYSGIIAIVITVVLCGINWIKGAISGEIWGMKFSGGEHVAWYGFGVLKEKSYPIFPIDKPIASTSRFSIEPISLFCTLLIVFIFVLLIWTVSAKVSKKHV